jgi:hypothetical protein
MAIPHQKERELRAAAEKNATSPVILLELPLVAYQSTFGEPSGSTRRSSSV